MKTGFKKLSWKISSTEANGSDIALGCPYRAATLPDNYPSNA
jgi:hypothetical protein